MGYWSHRRVWEEIFEADPEKSQLLMIPGYDHVYLAVLSREISILQARILKCLRLGPARSRNKHRGGLSCAFQRTLSD